MSGKQITIKKSSLLAMPVPQPTVGEETSVAPDRITSPFGASAPALDALLIQVCKAMQLREHPPSEFAALDKMAHFLVGARYGRTREECEADYRWWCDRTNVNPAEDDWATGFHLLESVTHKER